MKILHIYRNAPSEEVKKLVQMVSEGRETERFDLNVETPDYDKLVTMIFNSDQSICWW